MATPGAPRTTDPAAGFRRTRDAHARETAEDYVEAVADLIDSGREARVRDLARLMGVSHVTVSRIVSRLASLGLVRAAGHRPITLTSAGRRLAQRSRRRHEIVVRFLRALGVPARQAGIDAEGIEHHVSEATIRAMERAAGSSNAGTRSRRVVKEGADAPSRLSPRSSSQGRTLGP